MKKQTLLEKIASLFGKQLKRKMPVPHLSQKFKQQPRYKASHIEESNRKKGFKEKWQTWRQKQKSPFSVNEKGRQSHRVLKPILLMGFVLFSGYLILTGSMQSIYGDLGYFRIHEIEISGCLMTNQNGLRKFADISYEMNMLTLDPKAIQERLQSHPWIAVAKIRRIWPDRLAIAIRENRPQALVTQDGEDGFGYLDRKGEIFTAVAPGQELDFPVITGLDAFDTDAEREQLLKEALSFLRLAGRNNPNLPAQNVSEIHFDAAGELIVYLVEHPFPIYLGKGEVKRKYIQLHQVLEVLYRKKKGKAIIENVAYIRMDYQENKVLVAQNHPG